MPTYGRKKYQYKRRYKRRTTTRRPKTTLARSVNLKSDIHYFQRLCYKGTIAADVTRTARGTFTFQLNDLPALTDFTNLFDYYKITGVKLRFSLNLDPSAQTALMSQYPRMFYSYDYDDATVPTDSNELRQRGKCREWLLGPNKPLSIFIKPKTLSLVSNSLVQNGYAINTKQQWLDLGVPDTTHYGFKYVIESLNSDASQTVLVDATYYLAFRGSR